MIQIDDGEFFGTARAGGESGNGTLFKISKAGKIVVMHAFSGGADGAYPVAPLMRGRDGAFYGGPLDFGAKSAGILFLKTWAKMSGTSITF